MQDDVRVGLARHRPVAIAPLHVQIEVTWRCNWRCVHCYQDDHRAEALSTADLRRLFGELRAAGAMHLVVTGGEPLVRGDLLELLAHARGLGLAITLYTNGHAIDDATADRLAPLLAAAELTLLAGTADVHDRLASVRGAFARTTAAIERLIARGVHVVAKTPVMIDALPTLPALRDRLAGLGVEWQPDLDITPSYAGDRSMLAYALSSEQRAAFFAAYPEHRARPDAGAPRGLCLAGRQFVFVDAFGEVFPCLNFRSDAGPEHARARLGNIRTHAFAEIWQHAPLLRAIRDARRDDFTTCTSCGGRDACRPCMAHNLRDHGSLFEPSATTCELTAAQQPGLIPASRLRQR